MITSALVNWSGKRNIGAQVFRALALAVCVWGIVLCVVVAARAQQKPSGFGQLPKEAVDATNSLAGKKRLISRTGKSLLEELRPTDEVLEVLDWQPTGTPVPPPAGHSAVEMLTVRRPVVLMVTVRSLEGSLSPDANWVETILNAEVVQVAKNDTSEDLSVGSMVKLATPGGEVKVGRQVIRGVNRDLKRYSVGQTYLMFVLQRGVGWYVDSAESAEIKNDELVPMSSLAHGLFREKRAEAAVTEILAFARAKKQ